MTSLKAQPTRMPLLARLVLGALTAFILGTLALIGVAIHMSHSEVRGALHASGPILGSWTLTPDHCESGDRRGFFGVSLFSQADKRLRVSIVDDPARGYVIAANIPDTGKVLSLAGCTVPQGDVHFNGVEVNGVRAVSGSLDIACSTQEASLSGHIEFRSCH